MTNKESRNFTKNCIKTAMITLMGEKKFEDISITELVYKAGVSRTAFYRNYKTKENVLTDIYDSFNIYVNDINIKNDLKNNSKLFYINMFTNLKKYKNELIQLTKAQIINSNLFYKLNLFQNLEEENNYINVAFYGALIALIAKWIKNGLIEGPEEMGDLCYSLFTKYF
ncbi:MAG: TetR/AcrR family transcriptional regulator [Anaeroplasma sp.]